MAKLILSNLIMMFSLMMMSLNNPLSMGLLILIQTMLTCLLLGMLMKTYWFSYILFLIFLGGLLVLFIYVSSIASNELFKPSFNMKIMSFIILFINILMILYFMNNIIWLNLFFNSDMENFFNNLNIFYNFNLNKINLNKLYNSHNYLSMLMLIIYLLITLIAVVKITNIFYGPLRSKF